VPRRDPRHLRVRRERFHHATRQGWVFRRAELGGEYPSTRLTVTFTDEESGREFSIATRIWDEPWKSGSVEGYREHPTELAYFVSVNFMEPGGTAEPHYETKWEP
jgi:hypothetical protein